MLLDGISKKVQNATIKNINDGESSQCPLIAESPVCAIQYLTPIVQVGKHENGRA